MMFGEHDQRTAHRIAEQKTIELGRKCIVVPGIKDPQKFTVAVRLHATDSGKDVEHFRKS